MLDRLVIEVPVASRPNSSAVWLRNIDSILDAICGVEKRVRHDAVYFFEEAVTLLALDGFGKKILAEHPDERRSNELTICKTCVLASFDPKRFARPEVCPRGRR